MGSSLLLGDDARDPRSLNKANEAIGLRVREGKLSLLDRKVLNVLVYNAQQVKVTGNTQLKNIRNSDKYYWIPLRDLAKSAYFTSNDTALLKDLIRELQGVRLEKETSHEWVSEVLVSSVRIVNAKGERARGGEVWLGYAFPPEVEESFLRPSRYTKLSLQYQGSLRTNGGLALYEICRRYATSPGNRTHRDHWQWWWSYLTGTATSEGINTEYKYFKRDVLRPAIAEVNSLTDIEVELVEHKKGRRVDEIQFMTTLARQQAMIFPAPPFIDSDLYLRVVALGMSEDEAKDAIATHDAGKLGATLDLVEERLRNTAASPLLNPAAYLKKALTEGYAAAVSVAQNTQKRLATAKTQNNQGQKKLEELRMQYLTARARDAFAMLQEMAEDERSANLSEFFESDAFLNLPAPARRAMSEGRGTEISKSALGTWFAQKFHGDPTNEDIYAFAVSQLGQGGA